jgi:hypothetical protein
MLIAGDICRVVYEAHERSLQNVSFREMLNSRSAVATNANSVARQLKLSSGDLG